MITRDEAEILIREIGPLGDGEDIEYRSYDDEEYDELVDRGLLRGVGDHFETTEAGIAELKKYIRCKRKTKQFVGYVIKVGDEYAVGNGYERTLNPKKAHVFEPGCEVRSFEGWGPLKWAQQHMKCCHPGGRIVARYRYV